MKNISTLFGLVLVYLVFLLFQKNTIENKTSMKENFSTVNFKTNEVLSTDRTPIIMVKRD